MAKKRPQPQPRPEPPINDIDEESNDGHSLQDWWERQDAIEEQEYDEWLKENPRAQRKTPQKPIWIEEYDPSMGVN